MSCSSRICLALLALLALLACRTSHEPSPQVLATIERSEVLARQALFGEAILEAEKAVRADPRAAAAYTQLGRMRRLAGLESGAAHNDRFGHYARAREALERAIALDARAPAPRIELAELLADSGKAKQAVALLEPAAARGDALSRFHLAAILSGLGEYPRAIELMAAGLRDRPDDAAAQRGYGVLLLQQGKLEPAHAALAEAVRLDPTSSESFFQLGIALGKLGRDEDALLAQARAVELDPQSTEASYALASALGRKGRAAEAERYRKRFEQLQAMRARVASLEEALADNPADLKLRLDLRLGLPRSGTARARPQQRRTGGGGNARGPERSVPAGGNRRPPRRIRAGPAGGGAGAHAGTGGSASARAARLAAAACRAGRGRN